jgi:hypothetical protein
VGFLACCTTGAAIRVAATRLGACCCAGVLDADVGRLAHLFARRSAPNALFRSRIADAELWATGRTIGVACAGSGGRSLYVGGALDSAAYTIAKCAAGLSGGAGSTSGLRAASDTAFFCHETNFASTRTVFALRIIGAVYRQTDTAIAVGINVWVKDWRGGGVFRTATRRDRDAKKKHSRGGNKEVGIHPLIMPQIGHLRTQTQDAPMRNVQASGQNLKNRIDRLYV